MEKSTLSEFTQSHCNAARTLPIHARNEPPLLATELDPRTVPPSHGHALYQINRQSYKFSCDFINKWLPRRGLQLKPVQEPYHRVAKRWAKNREAQRRFRERKKQQKMLLQENTEDLRDQYQVLLTQYAQTASDVTRLVKENEVLRFEVESLRQQWGLVVAVLQQLQGAQSPFTFPEDMLPFNDIQGSPEELANRPVLNSTN